MPWTLTRDLVSAQEERRGALLRGALIANLGMAAGLGALVVTLYLAGPLQRGLEGFPMLVAIVAALPLIAVAAIARAAAQGISLFGRVAIIQAAEVTVKAAVGLALAGVGFGAIGAAAGFPTGALVAAAIGVALVLRRIPVMARSIALPALGRAAPMFAALLGLALILNLDLQAMKLLVTDRAATGQYQAAIILANAPYFLVSSAIVPVLFTRLAEARSVEDTRGRIAEALRLAVGLVLPGELLLVAMPDVVLGAFFPPALLGRPRSSGSWRSAMPP